MLGAIAELSEVELAGVEAAVGQSSFKRGRGYARNRVVAIKWDPDADTLVGSVVGQGARYDTAAFFAADPEGALAFDDGECTCPVGYNCKHVAAIVIAAIDGRGVSRSARDRRPARRVATAAQPPSWEQPLRALIDAPVQQTAGDPLAIELALHAAFPGRGAPRLMARLMRPGVRGGWVNGSLTWSGLDSWHVQSGDYRADHLALVRELYAVHRAGEGRVAYHSHYGGDKTLDLSGCDSRQLWSLLDEGSRLGLQLVHALPGLGEVRCHQRGELLIDVTRQGDQGSLVTIVLRVDGDAGDELEPLLFLGGSGHGIVCAERAEVSAGHGFDRRRLRLVRLARPAPPQLRRMVLDGERLQIPPSELDGFADELCPPCATSPRSRPRTTRSSRPRSLRRGSRCARATGPATSSRPNGDGITRSARRRGAQRSAPTAPARGFAISPPSARSSPTPCSPGPTSSVSDCSTAPDAPLTLRRSRSPASTACGSRRMDCRGCSSCRASRSRSRDSPRTTAMSVTRSRSGCPPPTWQASATGSTSA